ncbi:MAG TPA: tetratricopeptide repeat protein [Candidatus Cybelea sp.]|jgi:predicted ATPase/class 3 adenylate cyclase|nr:tetratricopeptide repeat protein [Candidatus Cybelea sp.]
MVTGTVTFLFTDIEGSTQRWERDRGAMGAALRRHDALLSEAVTAHGGEVFKTVGDAFCAVFPSASAALAASLDAQRGLLGEDFLAVGGAFVRMALHTGTAEEREGDYFGPTVNRVARLLAIAHGGQVVISSATAELLLGELPSESSLRDLGPHRLKDLTRPEHVYQLVARGLPESFPTLRSLDSQPNNLPLQLTSFVGRDDDVREIKVLLCSDRLVTLVGAGGAGKTRCAIQVGAELLDAFADGVWLVEFAPISDPRLVAGAVAQVLSVSEPPNRPLLDTLLAHLKHRSALLILDNCEHVIDEARRVVAAILRACPGVRILATSRESLNVAGERVVRLPSLAVPPPREVATARAARSYGAVALFADRATASDARFRLTDQNAAFVTEISRRLDGIPLAIELAAARIKVLSPQQLAQRLDERFRVLTGGDRSALPRHQTMRALIDWSYDLLSEEERALFRTLSIFAGGFTLESASAVCGNETLDEFAVLELLTSLVDKSLVQSEPGEYQTRYRLLESTRQYAREKLNESGEYAAVARAHAAAFLESAQRLEAAYDTTPDDRWFEQVEPEVENWRAALEWALTARGDVLLGQRLAGALGREWAFLATAEGRRWIRAAQESVDATTPPEVVARLDLCEAQLDGVFGLHKASCAAAQRALERCRELNDTFGVAQALRHAGRGLVFTGRIVEGEKLLHEALATFRNAGASTLTGAALENIAVARNALGDSVGARAYFAEALEIFKANGADRLAAALANNLAETEFRIGNAEAALQLAGDVLATDHRGLFAHRTGFLTCNIAAYQVALGRYDEARSQAHRALAMARTAHYDVAVVWAMQHLAAVAALRPNANAERAREDRRRSARLLAHTDARLSSLEALREYTEQQEYDRVSAVLHQSFDESELAALAKDGRGWTEEQAVTEALLI